MRTLEPLTINEEDRIHQAALSILEETGLQVPASSPVASRLREAGLRVPADGRVLLSRARVEAALESAPRVVTLGARDPGRAIVLDGSRTFATTDGCGSQSIDLETGRRRPSILADVAASARLTDALDGYDVYWSMVSALDAPLPSRVAREYLTALQNTTKHIQMIDVSRPEEAALLVRMAREVTGGGAATQAPVSMLTSVVSPLRLDPGGTEAALAFAAAGLPVAACSMPIASVTSPATAPGLVTLAHAEILGFSAVLQILEPGARVIYCSFPAFAHARTGSTNYLDPRRFWAHAAATRLGQRVHLPSFTSGESVSFLMRADLVCFGGLLETSTLLSLEQLVIDYEILRDWREAAAPQAVDAESLALEAIRDVGPGGHYLTHRHTARHIREFVLPRFVEADRPVEPDGAASPEPAREKARAEARRLIATHSVPPLPGPVEEALSRLVAGAATAGAG